MMLTDAELDEMLEQVYPSDEFVLCSFRDWNALIAQAREANRFRRDAEAMDVLRVSAVSLSYCDEFGWGADDGHNRGIVRAADPADALLAWKERYEKQETIE